MSPKVLKPTRRQALLAVTGALAFPGAAFAAKARPVGVLLAELEKRAGGRLGVCAIDTRFGGVIGHRLDERFALCSTFKLLVAAAVFERADQGKLQLDKLITYGKADILANSPATAANLAKGSMTVLALAEAAQKQSDNTAANLLMKQLGGPAGLTQFFRRHGDSITRVDRFEPEMNEFSARDPRDTTSPYAVATLVEKILTGPVLATASRALLIEWMIATKTGVKRIRAGLPKGWRAGDKTGTGLPGKYNDVAICWPPRQPPVIIAVYYDAGTTVMDVRDRDQKVIADAARIVAEWVS
ncbi:MAG: class A beta-lactamase [Alphaproteobacteria bacterium]|nr:class A beta-lactamase [Alphaproteobacteria bacterium]